jgi:hypothetical protein
MVITKAVHDSIAKKLELEQRKIRLEIERNKREMAGIVDRQIRLKRELAELQKLIKLLRHK